MKKYALFVLTGLLGIVVNLPAQKIHYRNNMTASAGRNLFQNFSVVSSFGELNTVNLKIKATPAYGLAYDYGVKKWLSIGLAGAWNNFRLTADQIVVPREGKTTYVGPVDLDMSRFNAGIRPLIHYGNLRRIDMYSGLRMGINIWKTDLQSAAELSPEEIDPFLHDDSKTFNFQIIPFGLKGYLTRHFAIGFETAFGAPYFAAVQLCYNI